MYAFAVVAAKPGHRCPPAAFDLLHDESPADLPFPFRGNEHVHWHDDANQVQFAAWQDNDRLGIGLRWDVRPEGVTSFGGLTWHRATPWASDRAWAAQLAQCLGAGDLTDVVRDFDGAYSIVSLAADGTGGVMVDPLGMTPLYRAETDDIVVASNHAALAARLVARPGRAPTRDTDGVGWLIYGSTLQEGRTGFAGVHRVPEGALLQVGPDRPLAIHTWDPVPWWPGPPLDDADVPAAVDRVADTVRGLVRVFADLPSERRELELTGGHDSRLILAVVLAEGLADRFSYLTWGSDSLPDVQIAGLIAERFELDQINGPRSAGTRPDRRPAPRPGPVPPTLHPFRRLDHVEPDFEAEVRHHVWATSGGRSLWDRIRPGLRPSANVSVCGVFGELLRSISARAAGLVTPDDIRAYVTAGGLHADAAGVLKPEVKAEYDRRVVEQILALPLEGATPQDALDGYYLRCRLREWFGTAAEHDNRNRVYPLLSLPLVRTAFALGATRRRDEEAGFRIVRAACDELARMPFAGEGWPTPTVNRLPEPEAYPATDPAPLWTGPTGQAPPPHRHLRRLLPMASSRSGPPAKTKVEAGRASELADHLPVLRSLLDLGRNHPLFDLVDRRAAVRAIDRATEMGYYGRRSVYDLITGAVWLDHGERPADVGHRPAE